MDPFSECSKMFPKVFQVDLRFSLCTYLIAANMFSISWTQDFNHYDWLCCKSLNDAPAESHSLSTSVIISTTLSSSEIHAQQSMFISTKGIFGQS